MQEERWGERGRGVGSHLRHGHRLAELWLRVRNSTACFVPRTVRTHSSAPWEALVNLWCQGRGLAELVKAEGLAGARAGASLPFYRSWVLSALLPCSIWLSPGEKLWVTCLIWDQRSLKLALLSFLAPRSLLPCRLSGGRRRWAQRSVGQPGSASLPWIWDSELRGAWVSSQESEILIFLDCSLIRPLQGKRVFIFTKTIPRHSAFSSPPQNCCNFPQVLSSDELHLNIQKVGYVNIERYRECGRNMHLPLILVLLVLKLQCERFILLFLWNLNFFNNFVSKVYSPHQEDVVCWFGFFSVTNCIVLFGEYVHKWERIAFINKSKAYAVKTEIVPPFYVQIKASVKPSATVHLICGNIKIPGLILKYSTWGRKYFSVMHCIQDSQKNQIWKKLSGALTEFIFPYFCQSSVQCLKACWSYTGVWISSCIPAFGIEPS